MEFMLGANGACAVLLAVLLLYKARVQPAAYFLAAHMLLTAAMALLLFLARHSEGVPRFLQFIAGGSGYTLMPALLYLYVLELCGRRRPWHFAHVGPFLLYTALFAFVDQGDSPYVFAQGFAYLARPSPLASMATLLIRVALMAYPILALWRVRQHRAALLEHQSTTETLDLAWIEHFIWASLGLTVLSIGLFLPGMRGLGLDVQTALALMFAALTANTLYFGAYGLRQGVVTVPVSGKVAEAQTADAKATPRRAEVPTADLEWLNAFMQRERSYQQSRLSIEQLSEATQWTVERLSLTLHATGASNFFEFVNRFRVEQVKAALLDSKQAQRTLLDIGLEAGFNSKTAFNTTFRRLAGLTPSKFRERSELRENAQDLGA